MSKAFDSPERFAMESVYRWHRFLPLLMQDKIKNNIKRNKVPAIYYMYPIENLYCAKSFHHESLCHITNEGRQLLSLFDNNVHQFWNVKDFKFNL